MLTIAFFGSGGDASLIPLEAVARHHRIIAVVTPARGRSRFRRAIRVALSRTGIGLQAPMFKWAKLHDVPLLAAISGRDNGLASRLEELAPDVICVSAFPWLLGSRILRIARRTAMNVHPSLLPRHRGPNPWFWVYYHSDRKTGVTIHQMSERADAGDILAQEAFDLPRGFPVDRLYDRNSVLGSELLLQVLGEIEADTSRPVAQDEGSATRAPRVAVGTPMVNFDHWEVERVWHFLAGLCPKRREPLRDSARREVRYEAVIGYTPGNCQLAPGIVQRASFGWNLYCLGGSVQLADARNAKRGATP